MQFPIVISRHVGLVFSIDTNRINARGNETSMNQLETWNANGVIAMEIPCAAREECERGHTDAADKRGNKARGYVISLTAHDPVPQIPDDQFQRFSAAMRSDPLPKEQYAKISAILSPNQPRDDNERNDVRIVANAAYYGTILITKDGGSRSQPGGILGNRAALKKAVGVDVLTAEEAVDKVRDAIVYRDKLARLAHENAGTPLPYWYQKD